MKEIEHKLYPGIISTIEKLLTWIIVQDLQQRLNFGFLKHVKLMNYENIRSKQIPKQDM